MQHSINFIGKNREEISRLRKNEKIFLAKDFFELAKKHKEKYSLIEIGEDFFVSSWHVDNLINDFQIETFKS